MKIKRSGYRKMRKKQSQISSVLYLETTLTDEQRELGERIAAKMQAGQIAFPLESIPIDEWSQTPLQQLVSSVKTLFDRSESPPPTMSWLDMILVARPSPKLREHMGWRDDSEMEAWQDSVFEEAGFTNWKSLLD